MSQHVYFVEEGFESVVLTMENGATIEVSVIGRDGVVGLPMLLGGRQMPGKTFVQVENSGFRMDAQFVKEQFEQPGQPAQSATKISSGPNLLQTAQNAACNRLHTISERLARWLLTCHDRLPLAALMTKNTIPSSL